MDHRDLLVEGHLREGVFHPRLEGLGVVQVDGKVRFLLGRLPARDGDKGEAKEEGSAVHSVSVLITYKYKKNLRKITSADLYQKVVRQTPTVQVDIVGPGSGNRRAAAGRNLPKTPKCPKEAAATKS